LEKKQLTMAFKLNKEKSTKIGALVVISVISLFVGVGIPKSNRLIGIAAKQAFPRIAFSEHQQDALSEGIISFVPLVKKLKPEVVQISTTRVSEEGQVLPSPFGEDDPFEEFWRRFFGNPGGPSREQSLGSGLIIASDGYILTNNHVIDNPKKVVVKLPGEDKEYSAKVIGKDPQLDIALIKIDAKGLPTAPLGDSDRLEVGEWVLAIGNPFGLDSTVTSGIVSAKERRIGQGPYDSFIQTDAKINPGNSGGPLINMRGEVVGINSAIFSESGENMGIGFAIPINMIKEILPQLKDKGQVTRGWIGVMVQSVTQDIAESMGLDQTPGALVSEVANDGPAARAGIKVGDLIIEFNGKQIKDANNLAILVTRTAPGEKVRVKILRDKRELTIPVQVEKLKDEEANVSAQEKDHLGLTVQKVTPEIAERMGIKPAEGIVITSVEPGSAADEAGLEQGDIIVEVNRKLIYDLSEYKKAVAAQKGKRILFLVRRGENTMFLTLKP
jgi:serine protease Do